MTDFFARLIERSSGAAQPVRPRLPSRFEEMKGWDPAAGERRARAWGGADGVGHAGEGEAKWAASAQEPAAVEDPARGHEAWRGVGTTRPRLSGLAGEASGRGDPVVPDARGDVKSSGGEGRGGVGEGAAASVVTIAEAVSRLAGSANALSARAVATAGGLRSVGLPLGEARRDRPTESADHHPRRRNERSEGVPQSNPVVRIRIGRIDVRAVSQGAAASGGQGGAARRSLEEYLRGEASE